MKTRAGLVLAGFALLAAGMGLAYLQKDGGARLRKPARNLILISIDTLRADHLGCYGYHRETSPRLDALAGRGTLFFNVTSSSSWTVPAHMTLFTGLEPIALGLIDYPNAGILGSDYVTLAQVLKRNGLRTAAFTGGGFVSPRHGFDIGFETFVSKGRRFEDNMAEVDAWIGLLEPGERFFLFLHGFNVHKPYKPPSPYDRRFCPEYAGNYDTIRFQPENPRPSPEDLDYVIAQYDGEIGYVDELLGAFLDRLGAKGILDETLVVVTSDHGDEMYEHGMVDHIHTLYDELVRVPLILAGPNVPKRVVREHIGQIDVFPTLCDLLGIGADTPMQGESRVSMFAAGNKGQRSPSESDDFGAPVYSFTGFSEYPYHLSSVRTSRWKLVVWSLAGMKDVDLAAEPERRRYTYKFRDRAEDFVELFDLASDPGEQHDLSSERPDVVQKLAAMLEQRAAESDTFLRQPGEIPEPTREYIDALKSLGYFQ